MTNTPGWESPGSSSGSSEPDGGDSPTPPVPPSGSTPESAQGSTPDSAASDKPEPSEPPHAGWSRQQPPAAAGWARWAPPGEQQSPGQPPPQHPQRPQAPPQQSGPRWGTPPQPGGWQHQGPWSRPAAPKPGVIPLRPLGVGEILDGSLATLRRHWRAIVGVTFAVALVTQGIGIVVQGLFVDDTRIKNLQDDPNPSAHDILHAFSGAYAGLGLTVLVVVLGMLVATAMLTMVAGRAVLGHTVTAAEAWRDAKPRLPQLLGLTLLLMVIYIGVLAVGVLPGILVALAGGETGGAALASLGGLGGMAVVIWLWIQWCLAPPALMLEKQGIVAAMKRSAKLVQGSWWRALGVQLLAVVLVYFATSIIELPFTLLGAAISGDSVSTFFDGDAGLSWTYLIVTGIGAVIASTVLLPISAGVTSLLYMDQRIRRESLDVELLRAAEQN
jgi:Membrane domain of glycerophosphoryl diester phosphodiesterase